VNGTKISALSIATLALGAAVLLTLAASANDQPVAPGTWVFVQEGSDNIETRIDGAVSHMNVVVRRIARSRLRGANKSIERIVVTYVGNDVHISLRADEPTVITPRNGEVVPYTREDGEVVRANTRLQPGLIRQFFDSDDGKKEIVYRMRPDGSLALETTVFSEKLREPFRYTWIYRQQG
jgi:hypothetical protein